MTRVGAIGVGMGSRHHQIAWAKLRPEVQVVAIADFVPDAAARRAAEFGFKRT
jgi:predicted dehydrogenase